MAAETRLPPEAGSPILSHNSNGPVSVTYRRQGDDNLLVEYGEMQLDIAIRMRVHLLMQAVKAAKLPGLIDLTPAFGRCKSIMMAAACRAPGCWACSAKSRPVCPLHRM